METVGRPPRPSPTRMRGFLTIWIGQLISLVGSGLTAFALAVWIFERTGQATPFALTVLFSSLPRILMSPIAGSFADRFNRRWVLILSDSGSALVTLAVAALVFRGELEVWHIYLVAFMGSVFAAFQEPAYTASVPMLVPKEHLTRANGLIQMGQAVEMLVAPITAGALFVLIGLRGILLIDFFTYFFAIGALFLVHIPQPAAPDAGRKPALNVGKDFAYGWRYLRLRSGLFGLLLFFALVNFLLNTAAVLMGPMILSFADPSALGVVQTVSGVGMLLGSLAISVWGGPRKRILAVLGFIALGAMGLVIAGLQPSPGAVALGLFLLMFAVPMASGPSQAIFQSKVEPGVQGRVFAMRSMIARSMMPLAFLGAGPLADRLFEPLMQPGGALAGTPLRALGVGPGRGMALMFCLAGALLLAATLWAFANPRIRNVEDELPDALPDAGAGETGRQPHPAESVEGKPSPAP